MTAATNPPGTAALEAELRGLLEKAVKDHERLRSGTEAIKAWQNAIVRHGATLLDALAAQREELREANEAVWELQRDLCQAQGMPMPSERIARDAQVERGKRMAEALRDVMLWIKNWSPSFTEDDEWPATQALVDAALEPMAANNPEVGR